MAHTAAKAVWGDGTENQEPVSGQSGDVSKGEPYDAGNIGKSTDEPEDPRSRNNADISPSLDPSSKETSSGNDNTENVKKEDPASDSNNKGGEDPTTKEVDVSGPGPRPLDQVAKENDGDAGNAGKEGSGDNKTESGEGKEGGGGTSGSSENEGTGEQVVTATGLHADGGDFDATKPGAGREADREFSFPMTMYVEAETDSAVLQA